MRVLVTRAEGDAEATAARVAERGHRPVMAPLARIRPLPVAWPGTPPDAVTATSAHAFDALPPAPPALAALPLYAVGKRTAEAARRAGFRLVADAAGDAATLAARLRAQLTPGARVLYLAGRTRKPDLESRLAAAGILPEVQETYAIEPADSLPDPAKSALEQTEDLIVLHFSRGTAERFLALCRSAGLESAAVAVRHLCLSADVAAPLLAAGAGTVVVAPVPREPALLDLRERAGSRAAVPPPGGRGRG